MQNSLLIKNKLSKINLNCKQIENGKQKTRLYKKASLSVLETCHLDSTSHNGRRGRFQTCPATKLIIKQKTASPIISDAWKKHKQVCAGKLPNGENINMRKR